MKYWRHYPKFLQTILLLLMVCTLLSFSSAIAGMLISRLYGVTISPTTVINANSPDNVIKGVRLVQILTSLFTFLGSALLFAYLTHPKPYAYLGFHKIKDGRQFGIVLLLMTACIPVLIQLGAWMQRLPLGVAALEAQARSNDMEQALMKGSSMGALLQQLFVMGLLPAIGEEMLFRGIFMRFSYGISRNIHFAVIFTGALFAMIHMQLYNFPSLMVAGVLLGYIYYYTGSLWLSIFGHLINNGVQITIAFLARNGSLPARWSAMENFPPLVVIAGAVLAGFACWLMIRRATPLAYDWNDDFKEN